jgi:hypothetical protein
MASIFFVSPALGILCRVRQTFPPVCGTLYRVFYLFIVVFFVVSGIIVNFAVRKQHISNYYDGNSKETSDDSYGTIFQLATGDES